MIIKTNPDGIVHIESPVFHQYIINDSTVEANADVFINQPRGVLLHNDEISSLPLGFDKYKKTMGGDKQHYLQIWNANPITINRATTGIKYVPNTGMGIIGGLPTRIVTKIFSEDDIHNGLLPRFLHVSVDSKLPYNNKTPSEGDKRYWNNFIDKCYAIPLEIDQKTGCVKPMILTLNTEAFDLYVAFRHEYDQLLELLPEITRVFIPKLQSYCLRFSGLLHILKYFDANKDITSNTVIDAETMKNAIKLTRYYTHQADKLVKLYSPQEQLKPHQVRLIKTLDKLRGEVKGGRLYLKRITEVYNFGLPEHLIFQGRHIGDILRKELGLDTDISHDSYLIWNDSKLKKYFKMISKPSKSSKETDSKSDKTHLQAESASQQTPETSTRGGSPQSSKLKNKEKETHTANSDKADQSPEGVNWISEPIVEVIEVIDYAI